MNTLITRWATLSVPPKQRSAERVHEEVRVKLRFIALLLASFLMLAAAPVAAFATTQTVPGNVKAVPGGTIGAPTVTVSWTGASGAGGYDIDRAVWNGTAYGSWTRVATVSSTTRSYKNPVAAGSRYAYRVRAFHHHLGLAHQSSWVNVYKIIWTRVSGVTVSPTSVILTPGQTAQITAAVAPTSAVDKRIKWSTSNSAVATVNTSGLVTAGAATGDATITGTSYDGSKVAKCTVRVRSLRTRDLTNTKPIPNLKQYNYTYERFGSLFRDWGCAVTSMTMSESYRTGAAHNPIDLINRNIIKLATTNNGLFWTAYWPTPVAYGSSATHTNRYTAASTDQLTNYRWLYSRINEGKPVILKVNGYSTHYVVVYGYRNVLQNADGSLFAADATKFLIRDPGSNNATLDALLNQRNSSNQVRYYKGIVDMRTY